MKNKIPFLFSALLLLLLNSCGPGKNPGKTDSIFPEDSLVETLPDVPEDEDTLSKPKVDTTFEMQVQNKTYLLVFTHEYHSLENPLDLATTVHLFEKGKPDTLLTQTFDYSTVSQLRNPAPGCYWLSLENSGGGSGYSAQLFNIRIKPFITIQPILKFDELSYWKSNRSGNELLFFEGYWNMANSPDSRNFESHFAPHRQAVSVYQIDADTILVRELGTSKHKYDFEEPEKSLREFKEAEPALAERISWEQYELETAQGGK